MERLKDKFIESIKSKNLIRISFDSQEKGIVSRICVPFDFGPSRRNISPNPDRFHMYDLDSPKGEHTLSILPEQLVSLEITEKTFEPSEYITWPWPPGYTPHWFISRDWGIYS
jgi:hypothetical protein